RAPLAPARHAFPASPNRRGSRGHLQAGPRPAHAGGSGLMPDFTLPPQPSLPGAPPEDILAGLRDIHLPEAVSFWPLAPGWWLLLWRMVPLVIAGAVLEWRRRQTLGYRAAQELKAIARDEARYQDARAVAAAAGMLMRRILVTKTGSPAAASLSGET